ncbi:hypothetical protein PIB30_066187 [Stylosanthes scabra]|uniref:Putative plant transposon protein domain-containing protein n=1 Tax=Stylosanthes scabra TaxID=79078 RepID=A0ABU6RMF2_9FABA|nr:hypothetical protein [Stylosanthes scabra]
MIPTGNKSEITVARAVVIRSIIKGHDVRFEELIADNIAVLAEGVQGRSKLCFPSIIYRLCKEAGVPKGEFRNTDQVQVARPITAKVMTTIRGRIINQPQNQPNEEDEDNYDAEYLYTNHEQGQEMEYEAEMQYEGAGIEEDNYQHQEQPNFAAYESNFQQYKEDQQQGFQFLNEELASMKIKQEQFFENMQKAQSQYFDELKALRTRQDEMIRKWTRNASSREGYSCWAHQQANPNLVEIPPHKIPDFLHTNVANKKDPYFGALKSDLQQGESSQVADQATQNPPNL